MVFALNLPVVPHLVATSTVHVSKVHFLVEVIAINRFQGHWCGRELAAMILHSQGCRRFGTTGAYEEARKV